MEAQLLEKQIHSVSNLDVFYSIFDPPEPESKIPKSSLLEPISKILEGFAFGPIIYDSKLHKKAKNIGFSISRHFFLSSTHLGYSKHENPSKIKKCTELKGLKVSIDSVGLKSKGNQARYSITLFKSKTQSKVYTDLKEVVEKWRENLSRYCIMTKFDDFYTVKEVLGKGAHGKVVLATNNRDGKDYAVKIFDKLQLITRLKGFDSISNEVNSLRKVEHKNIIKLYEVYESVNNIHLVIEFVEGGELYTKLKQKKYYSELQCSKLLKNILESLSYLHDKGIAHRDIKPENLVLISKDNDCEVKLVDFGFAVDVSTVPELKRCGTPGYVSPEVLNSKDSPCISTKIDIFAVGAIFYHLLTGSKLFSGNTVEEILKKNKQCNIDTFKLDARKVSPGAKDLLLKMLEKDPNKRIAAKQALDHYFFTNAPFSTTDVSEDQEEHSIGETNRYSFDMAHLKELNMYSQSKVLDSAGTFHITSHIPMDRQREAYEQEKPYIPAAHYADCSPKSLYSHATSNFTSESSFESLEESKLEERSCSPSSSRSHQRANSRSLKKSWVSNTPTTSPFHKAAIMNNLKKSHLMELKQSEMSENGEDSFSSGAFSDYINKLAKPKSVLSNAAKRNSVI